MSQTVVTIEGVFRVSSFSQTDYGPQATITEVDVDYPISFGLNLPEGHVWSKGDTFRLSASCKPMQFNLKAGGKMLKFSVEDYKKTPVRVVVEDVKPVK